MERCIRGVDLDSCIVNRELKHDQLGLFLEAEKTRVKSYLPGCHKAGHWIEMCRMRQR